MRKWSIGKKPDVQPFGSSIYRELFEEILKTAKNGKAVIFEEKDFPQRFQGNYSRHFTGRGYRLRTMRDSGKVYVWCEERPKETL